MTGTFINMATVITGTAVGLLLRSKLPKKLVKSVFQILGVYTIVIGFIMAIKVNSMLVVFFSLVIGVVTGEIIDLDAYVEKFSSHFKQKVKIGSGQFSEGFLTAFLMFCMGSMTILGTFEDGIKNDTTLLVTKSVMDGFTAIALASAFGISVGFSVIPMLLYQGGLTLLAGYLGTFFSDAMINELTATGGILLIALGLTILEIKKIKVFNLLPALVLAVVFAWLNQYFNLNI